MPHDLTPAGRIAKQLPAVAIGAAVEIFDEGGHVFGLLLEFRPRPYHIATICGRYASFLPAEFIAQLFSTVNRLPNLEPTWNMAPTTDAPVVRRHPSCERHLNVLKWGLMPYFTKDLKKARGVFIKARNVSIRARATLDVIIRYGRPMPSLCAASSAGLRCDLGHQPSVAGKCGHHLLRKQVQ
jgi:hypothetical protein